MDTIDFTRLNKELYHAGRTVQEVAAERATFLAVNGQGEPGGEAFQRAFESLYSVCYTLRFQRRQAGGADFKMPRPECLWYVAEGEAAGPARWAWRLQLRVPDDVTAQEVRAARRAVHERKGLDTAGVRRVSWREGRALQVLHVGPYDEVAPVYEALSTAAQERGYRVRGPAHEVYLNDPGRVAPERLRTIVRMPVSHPRPAHAHGTCA